MAFPPEFSSTETYENRYDLDEIDVFLEGSFNNPMFFNISKLPLELSFGKHYFNLSILDSTNQEYELRPESKILFEFKSINNVILKSQVTNLRQKNGIAVCSVEVLKDPRRTFSEVQDGQGTLSVVGSLQNKKNTSLTKLIPKKFLGAMNYRCIFPINIRKNILNADSPFMLQTTHIKSTLKGEFSFAKANISPMKTSRLGLTYDKTTGRPNIRVQASKDNQQGSTN